MHRKLISNPRFQWAFAFALARGIFLAVLLPGLATILILYLMSQHADLLPEQKTILVQGVNQFLVIFVGLTVALMFMAGVYGLIASQKFVGPLERIEGWLTKHLLKETPDPLVLRKEDELHPIALLLNKIIAKTDKSQ